MIPQVRIFKEEDYSQLLDWWQGHGWDGVPISILPKLGAIVSIGDKDICAGWLYMDNSIGLCMQEWLVANPDATGKQIFLAQRFLQDFFEREALRMDYGVMMTTCKQESLARLHERNGFMRTDSGMIHLIKFLRKKGDA